MTRQLLLRQRIVVLILFSVLWWGQKFLVRMLLVAVKCLAVLTLENIECRLVYCDIFLSFLLDRFILFYEYSQHSFGHQGSNHVLKIVQLKIWSVQERIQKPNRNKPFWGKRAFCKQLIFQLSIVLLKQPHVVMMTY